jgi:hypothetical protein
VLKYTARSSISTFFAVKQVRYLAVLASEEGLKNVVAEFPDLQACFQIINAEKHV